jgi:hypothetical protein
MDSHRYNSSLAFGHSKGLKAFSLQAMVNMLFFVLILCAILQPALLYAEPRDNQLVHSQSTHSQLIQSRPSGHTFNVMAPLDLKTEEQWRRFDRELEKASAIGVDGVSVDIWWGRAEASGDQVFDWSYYDRLVKLINKHQLQWIPIMSFHQCGGNVGDDCDIPIPNWVWSRFEGASSTDLKFKSEQGNYSSETLSFWQKAEVKQEIYHQYLEFMQEFASHFSKQAPDIQELNLSMGPAGELRYPSYNSHDEGAGYPSRGAVQGLNELALMSFHHFLRDKYLNITSVNKAWNTNYASFEGMPVEYDFKRVFEGNMHRQPGLMMDYFTWYHQSLLSHGTAMLAAAHKAFEGEYSDIPLAYKIPGIHWKIALDGGLARSAELAAGLIGPTQNSQEYAHGYLPILQLASTFQRSTKREVIVHFTALEMNDEPAAPAYSKAKTLVGWLSDGAKQLNITIKGENALAYGVHTKQGWQNINDAIAHGAYEGLTVLRWSDIADDKKIGYAEYKKLIEKYRDLN